MKRELVSLQNACPAQPVLGSTLFPRPSRTQLEITGRQVSIAGERLASHNELNGNCNTYMSVGLRNSSEAHYVRAELSWRKTKKFRICPVLKVIPGFT